MTRLEIESIFAAQIISDPGILAETIIRPEHFESPILRKAVESVRDLIRDGFKPDLLMINDRCGFVGENAVTLAELSAPTTANWRHYESELLGHWKKKRLEAIGRKLVEESKTGDPDEIIARIDKALSALVSVGIQDEVVKACDLVSPAMAEIEKRIADKGSIPGIPTGMPELDDMIGGLQRKKLYYIGARPSEGKSALGLSWANNIATRTKKKVGYFSLESSNMENILRLFSMESKVNSKSIAHGFLSKSNLYALGEAGERLFGSELYFYDVPNMSLEQIKGRARRMVAHEKIEVIFVDYLQIIDFGQTRMNRVEQVGEISKSLKNLARELNVPIVCYAQLNRESDGQRPSLRHFKDASQIEQDADVAMMIYHERDSVGQITDSWLIVGKQRDGETGDIPVFFNRDHLTFYEREKSGKCS